MNHRQKLLEIHKKAVKLSSSKQQNIENSISQSIVNHIAKIASKCFSQKGVYTVLITLLVHKILYPDQDIRYHQTKLENGFSGRSIDTQYITPTLKQLGLPAMAESGWLTRSLEQPYPYTLDYEGRISDRQVKQAFLEITNYVQVENPQAAESILLLLLKQVIEQNIEIEIAPIDKLETCEVSEIITALKQHFDFKYGVSGGSKLPVLAFHAIFTILIKELKRYENCTLSDVNHHTASDRTSQTAGDLEIFNAEGNLLEAIEIKKDRKIDESVIIEVRKKIYRHNPQRYYVFSSGKIAENAIAPYLKEIQNTHGCEVIVNGIIPTLKYYLRLIVSQQDFLEEYSKLVQQDKDLKPIHKTKWIEIIENSTL
ncbi:MAG: hypothetical protein SAJ12_11845 [Jaaginema sp. PMC 1079.18]|nr:hypothetical protein [Jaaginema sp. PMC 1080.18]MEC4851698.1 hypothetical protein [Jaaginema sp. PMC 1079.18]MEC4867228.1 hypothetical protein [Jaaginema sp. PMC 1078.18]